jgi:hypothetical protein
MPAAGLQVLSGEPVVGGLHGPSKHMFCGYCMTWMFTHPEGMDTMVNLRPSMLDDRSWFVPFIESYTEAMLPWARTGAVHSFPKFPEMSAYGALVREFAEKGARPK